MTTQFTSKNGKFICNTSTIKEDGCPVKLNPVHFGNHVDGFQVGFVTDGLDFFFDTNGEQVLSDVPTIKELMDFVDNILTTLSTQ